MLKQISLVIMVSALLTACGGGSKDNSNSFSSISAAVSSVAPSSVAASSEAPSSVAASSVAPSSVATSSVAVSSEAASSVAPSSVAASSVAASSEAASSEAASSAGPAAIHSYNLDADGSDSIGGLNLSNAGTGSVIFTDAGINGIGTAATFAVTHYLTNATGTFGFVPTSTFSIELWARFTALPTDVATVNTLLAEQINTSGDKGGFRIYTKTTTAGETTAVFRVLGDPATNVQFEATTNATLSTNVWYHIVAVYNAGAMTLYLNGVSAATQTFVPGASVRISPATADGFSIGGASMNATANPRGMTGSLDSVKVYNVALTADQVLSNFNNP